MSHFHGQRHIKGGLAIDPETIPPNAHYWFSSASDALCRLQDVVGDEEGRRMTENITGTWREIYESILILAELAEKQSNHTGTGVEESPKRPFKGKCICAGSLNDWPFIANPCCPIHGSLPPR